MIQIAFVFGILVGAVIVGVFYMNKENNTMEKIQKEGFSKGVAYTEKSCKERIKFKFLEAKTPYEFCDWIYNKFVK